MRLIEMREWRAISWLMALGVLLAALGVILFMYLLYGAVWLAGEVLGWLVDSELELDNNENNKK